MAEENQSDFKITAAPALAESELNLCLTGISSPPTAIKRSKTSW